MRDLLLAELRLGTKLTALRFRPLPASVAPPAVVFHPNAANAYRDKVRNLKRALASDEDSRVATHEAIREIVEKVVIHSRGAYKPVEIEIYGQLAALLRISERAAADPLESRGYWLRG